MHPADELGIVAILTDLCIIAPRDELAIAVLRMPRDETQARREAYVFALR